jgi:hypothetical protein
VEKLRKYWHGGAWERPTPKLGLFGEEFEIEKVHGTDYVETFAPTAKLNFFHLE